MNPTFRSRFPKRYFPKPRFAAFVPWIVFLGTIVSCVGGCFKDNENPGNGGGDLTEVQFDVIPVLSEKELEGLGAKNDHPGLRWSPDGGAFGLIAFPKRVFGSNIGKTGEDILLPSIVQATGIPVDFRRVDDLFVNGRIKLVETPPQPGVPYAVPRPLMQVVTYVSMETQIDKTSVLSAYLSPEQGFPVPKPRMVLGKEVYELPVAAPLELHAVVFLDDRSFLDVRADETILKQALDENAAVGALNDRLARATLENKDITLVGTSEGSLPFAEEEVKGLSQAVPMLPETLVKLVMENFRAFQLQINLSADENAPFATLRFDTTKADSAGEIAKAVNQQITYYRSGLPVPKNGGGFQNTDSAQATDDAVPETVPEAHELVSDALDALTVEAEGASVEVVFRAFSALENIIANYFQGQRNFIRVQTEIAETREMLNRILQRQVAIRGYMLAYHNEQGHFPSDIRDAQGNALLSWKVALLPYMGERNLHSQFKLDEPWDSAHNKPLINRMPMIFSDPRSADTTRSTYMFFSSPGTPFAEAELKMTEVPAPARTVMLVTVLPENASEWTRPNSLSLGQSQDDYLKLFGQVVPMIFFDGQGGHLFWENTPDALSRFENSVRGSTTNATSPASVAETETPVESSGTDQDIVDGTPPPPND